jgi:hypothetical protein
MIKRLIGRRVELGMLERRKLESNSPSPWWRLALL